MSAQQVFDTIEKLFAATAHPDIAQVERHGTDPQGVTLVCQDGAKAFLWPVPGRTAAKPVDLDDPGDYKAKVGHVLRMLVDLLDIVQPAGWQWRTVAVEGVHRAPCGLEVRAAGTTVLIRVTCGGPPAADSDPAAWDGWQYPVEQIRAAVS